MTNGHLVDLLLPAEEVHLLGGPSGAGKTRWLLHSLLQWQQGLPFLELPSHPVPWVYIAADRSCTSVCRTLTGMGISPHDVLAINAWDQQMTTGTIMDRIVASKAQLAVWESFGSFVEAPGQGKQVKEFLGRMSRFCQSHHVTIIGIVESPKQKPYEKYENPRQRISGAAAWGHFSETIFLVEPDFSTDDPGDPYRTLYVCPRNYPGMKILLCFDMQGCLLPIQDPTVYEMLENRQKKRKKRSNSV